MNNDGKLALAVNNTYRHKELNRDDLAAEFDKWGLRTSELLIFKTLENIAALIDKETPLTGAHPFLQHQIKTFVNNLMTGRRVGDV